MAIPLLRAEIPIALGSIMSTNDDPVIVEAWVLPWTATLKRLYLRDWVVQQR